MNKPTIIDHTVRCLRSQTARLSVFIWCAAFAVSALLLCSSDASAYQVKRVMRGTTSMGSGDETITQDLGPAGANVLNGTNLNMERSLLLFNYQMNSSYARVCYVMGMIDDETTLSFNRKYSGTAAIINWTIIEFCEGVTVTSGVTIFADVNVNPQTKTITIPAVPALNKAFVVVSNGGGTRSITTADESYRVAIRLVDTTHVQLQRGQGRDNGLANLEVYYQVVSFAADDADVLVQHGDPDVLLNGVTSVGDGEVAASDTGTQVQVTIPTALASMNDAFLYFTYWANNAVAGIEQQYAVDGDITSTSAMTFRRINNTNSVGIWWQVIQLRNPAMDGAGSVYYGQYAVRGRIVNSTVNTVVTTGLTGGVTLYSPRSFPLISVSGGGAADASSFDEVSYTGYLDSAGTPPVASNILVDRDSVAATGSNISWTAIELPPLNLTGPNGAETWVIGQPVTVTWQYSDDCLTNGSGTGGVHRLLIELTTDGTNYVTFADNVDVDTGTFDNAGSYTTTLQQSYGGTNIIGENTRIRITDKDLTCSMDRKADRSNNTFVVKGALTVTSPTSASSWTVGTSSDITWSYVGQLKALSSGNTVTISCNPGAGYLNIVAGYNVGTDGADVEHPGSGSYSWTIPAGLPVASPTQNLIGDDNIVKVTLDYGSGVAQTKVEDETDPFTIKGRISSVTRDPDETWILAETVTISWTKDGYFGSGVDNGYVKIYYAPDGSTYTELTNATGLSAYPVPAGANGGSVTWVIPKSTQTSNPASKIKVTQATDETIYKESAAFQLQPSLEITAPVNGQILRYGDNTSVNWLPHGQLGFVNITYTTDNWATTQTIASNVAAGDPEDPQTKSWTVSNPIGLDVKLRVSKSDNAAIYDEVAIQLKPVFTEVTVSQPGSPQDVIRVTDATENNVATISWEYLGEITDGHADIYLSTDGSTFPIKLATGDLSINNAGGGTGTYSWTVLTGDINTVKARVVWREDTEMDPAKGSMATTTAFQTVAYLKLLEPGNASPTYTLGAANKLYIKWQAIPTTFNVVINYSTQSGAEGTYTGYITTVSAANKPNGSDLGYEWPLVDTVPVKDTMRIKIEQEGKAVVESHNTADFKIVGSITLTGNADGGGTWLLGEDAYITWTTYGNIGLVDISYAQDGTNYTPVTTGYNCNRSDNWSYTWPTLPTGTITGDISTTGKIKIQPQAGSTQAKVSAGNVTVRAKIFDVAPTSGSTVYADDPDDATDSSTISWKLRYYQNIPNDTKLILSYDPGTGSYTTINDNVQAPADTWSYSVWEAPAIKSDNFKVRVQSAAHPDDVYAVSSAAFKVRGKFGVISPTAANVGASAFKVHSADLTSTHEIKVRNTALMNSVKVEYATDGSTFYDLTTLSGAAGVQTYNWNPPATWNGTNTIGTTNRLRFTDPDDPLVPAKLSAPFEIKGQLDLLTPGGGEPYDIGGDPIPITWKYAGNFNVNIWFSSDLGANYTLMHTSPSSDGGYNLAVPNVPTVQGIIKISAAGDDTVSDQVPLISPIRIRGTITSIGVEGAPWNVNAVDANKIVWTATGAFENVALALDVNDANTYGIEITGSTPNDGEYFWNIPEARYPDVTYTGCRIRARDAADISVEKKMDTSFEIKPVLWVTHPQGETWEVGSTKNITWDYYGTIANVRIEYSEDGVTWPGTGDYLISAGTPASAKSKSWTVPDTMSDNCVMRISRVGGTAVTDDSNTAFSIKPKIVVNEPLGGAVRANGTTDIKWTTTGTLKPAGTVKLKYVVDGGEPVTITAAGDRASPNGVQQSYTWTIPDIASNNVQALVVANDDTNVVGTSSTFGIRKLNILAPIGTTHWAAGTTKTIQWSSTGITGNVQLSYSLNGTDWSAITPTDIVAASAGNVNWAISNTQVVDQSVFVKIVDVDNAATVNTTSAAFDIMEYLEVTGPALGQDVIATQPVNITWNKAGSGVDKVLLEYTKNGTVWNYVKTDGDHLVDNTGSYPWTVPADALTATAQIRITDPGNPNATHTGPVFQIYGAINVTIPNGTQSWEVGSSQDIFWTITGNIANVEIFYSPTGADGTWTSIGTTTGADGADGWTWANISPTLTLSKTAKIKVVDSTYTEVSGVSSGNLELKGKISNVAVGSSILTYAGDVTPNTTTISWTKAGNFANVDIHLSYDGGTSYPVFIKRVASDASPTDWNVPNYIDNDLKIRVKDATDGSSVANYSSIFKIKGAIVINAPTAVTEWSVKSPHNVLWTPVGTYADTNVQISYSADGTNWVPIISVEAGAHNVQQSYAWTPDGSYIGTNRYLKIETLFGDPDIDVSAVKSGFKLTGAVNLTYPDASGIVWNVGTDQTITWTASGLVTPVKIEYSTTNGSSWTELTSTHVGVDGDNSYKWTSIPGSLNSEECLIRVSDARTDFASVTDMSTNKFSIRPVISISAPVSGQNIPASSSVPLRWSVTGSSITLVDLYYSVDNGGNWVLIEEDVPVGQGATYNWPNSLTSKVNNQGKVRVVDSGNPQVIATMTGAFSVIGNLDLLTLKSSAASWEIGTEKTISWNSWAVTNVRGEYSLDGGTNWNTIENGTDGVVPAANASMPWNIPNDTVVNQNVKIRIVDNENDQVTVSTSVFPLDLRARFSIDSPIDGATVYAGGTQAIQWDQYGTVPGGVILEYTLDGTTWNYVRTDGDHKVAGSYGVNIQYPWSVPADALTSSGRVRIYDPNNASYKYQGSGAALWIKGIIFMLNDANHSPRGGESWSVGTAQQIKWTTQGTINKYLIYYAADGTNFQLISPAASEEAVTASPWTWNIPTDATLSPNTGKIKVVKYDDATTTATSQGTFEVKGAIQNVRVAGVESGAVLTYTGTSTTTITWEPYGSLTSVNIMLATDGVTFNTITTVAATPSTYNWTIPNAIGNTLKIKVKDAAVGSTVEGVSNTFKIKGGIVIDEPTALTDWTVKSSHNILWTPVGTYTGKNVLIEYSSDGTNWTTIATAAAGANGVQQARPWTPLATDIGTNRNIRITTQFGDADIDVSAVISGFKLSGIVTIGYPDASGIVWNIGTEYSITWNATGLVTPVKIEYSTNDGSSWTTLTDTHAGVDGDNSYPWTVPGSLNSEQCRIRVSDARSASFPLVTDTSANMFSIRPTITVSQPVAGQNVPAKGTVPLRWSVTGSSITQVNLQYSVNNGIDWTTFDPGVAVGQGSTYNWTNTFTDKIANLTKVRVVDASNDKVIGNCSGAFNIVGNLELLTLKEAGASWEIGTTQSISWNSTAVTNVKGEYSLDGGNTWTTIQNPNNGIVPASNGSMIWEIPNDTLVCQTAKIRIVDNENQAVTKSTSINPLDLRAKFAITEPINGATVYAEENQYIRWTPYGTVPGGVILEYTTDGTTWNYVNTDGDHKVANNGEYVWAVPANALTSLGRVRIYDPDNASYKYTGGGGALSIKGQIFMLNDANHSPRGGESWSVGSGYQIKWTKKGAIAKYLIYYAADGTNFQLISPAASGEAVTASPWTWNIPSDTTLSPNTAKIKIVKYDDATTTATSNGVFEVKGAIQNVTVASPVLTYTGEDFPTATQINWEPYGQITSVTIQVSSDGGVTYTDIQTVAASAHPYTWNVPNKIGNNLKIKVKDAAVGSTVEGVSSVFKIKGAILILAPTNEEWLVKNSHDIQWSPVGTYTGKNVKIEYSPDNTNWTEIATKPAGAHGSTQTCAWTPGAATIGTQQYIRITTLFGDPDIDVSTTVTGFKLKGEVTLTYPDLTNIVWNIGTDQTITWNSTGLVTPVKIEYTTNGTVWNELTSTHAGVDGDNSYTWTSIPGSLNSEQCRIRVSDARVAFASVTDTSANPFSIRPTITVSQPVAGQNVPASGTIPLRWSVTGSSITAVDLQYSVDNGSTWTPIEEDVPVGQGTTYTWTNGLTSKVTNQGKVRVVDANNDKVIGTMVGAFNVVGKLELVTLKDTPENWFVNTTQNITWNYAAVTTVKAYYSLDGTNWVVINNLTNGEAPASDKTIPWIIPPTQQVDNTVWIKIVDKEAPTVTYSTSIQNLALLAKYEIVHPRNGDILIAEDPYDKIEWTSLGEGVTQVLLEYSTDGKNTWNKVNPVEPYLVDNSGSYIWPAVPGTTLSDTCYMRVSDPNNALTTAVGDTSFRIKGYIAITRPTTGTENFSANTPESITWTKKGNIGNISVYYSYNEGLDGTWGAGPIGTNIPANNLTWTWNIPEDVTLTTKGRVKVTSMSDSTVTSMSANNFTIKGRVEVTSPNTGAESWSVGTGHAITWDTFGAISAVDIYLSTTGGSAGGGYPVNPNVATSIQASLETYSWNIPADTAISKQCRIKVQDHDNASVWDESNANFEIKGQVDLTYPDLATTKWFYNEPAQIRWTPTGNFSQVLIEYSTDNFTTATTIVQTDAGASGVAQTFNWGSVTIPCSDTVKIRISDPNSPTVTDQSSQAFAVRGRLTILVPNGTETWKVNTQQAISWSTKGTIPNIKLYFSKDGGAYTAITTDPIANSSPYPWTIPDQISDNVLVKITDAAHDTDTDVDDESDAAFKIIGNIVITSPVGALPEAWIVGSTQNITWNTNGTIPSVSIYYSDDGGNTYPYEITPGTSGGTGGVSGSGSFSWTPIPNNPKTTCKVKIMQVGKEGTVFSISPQTFKIIGDIIINPAQHNPKPGMEWIVEQQQKITWDLVGAIQNVKIELSTDSGANYDYQIAASTPAGAKEFYWDVPDTKCSPTARIKISDANDNTVFKTTAGDFKLQPQFTITNPLGNQIYKVNEDCLITWTTDYGVVPNVRLEYSYDNGSNWTDIVGSMSNTGSKAWKIPDHISESVMVRISDTRDPSADYTTGAFKIRGDLQLLTPATGSAYIVNAPMGITWDATGTMGVVTLQMSTTGAAPFNIPIATNVASADESYNWTTPNNITNQAMVKIFLEADSTVYDETGLFYIRGALTVLKPNGPSDQWVVGTTENITWTRTGNIQNVKIILSTDGGLTYPEGNVITPSYSAVGGSFPWPIPDQLSTNLKIKVADASDETNVFDVSDGLFGIRGSLTLVSPNLGGLYYVGDNADITWTKQGSIQFIAIEGSTNAFADESQVWTIASPVDATGDPAGSYKKTVAVENKIGTNLKIRIKDMSNPTNVYDISESPFTIKGKLKMLYPDTATTLYVDDPLVIQWQTTGTINLVQLRYSTDGGTSFPEGNTIVASTDGMAGSYTTTVPNAIEPDIRFRVMDVADMAMPDDSDQNIVIKGKLSLTSPVTNVSWPVASNQNITWNYNGSIANVKIEYSVDGWVTSHEIVASASCPAKTYQWTNIPDDISNSARVRISNVLDSSVSSTSPVNFKIVGVLEVTSPTAASRWEVGVPATINWNVTGSIANVRIDYSANNGGSWTNIVAQVAASAKTTSWTPTPESVSLQALIRISDFSDSTVFDISEQFHVKARFNVSSPSGGLVWPVDSEHDIAWTTEGVVPTVRIDYCTDGVGTVWKPITVSTSNNSPYRWTVFDDISSTCKVKVSDTRDEEAFGVSAGLFKIRGDVQVLSPSDADISWIVGESHNITWDTTGTMPTVKIEYSINGGTNYTTLSASYDGTAGSMPWTVLDTLSKDCLVRISDTRDSTVYDVSNNPFTIRGSLAVDEPLATAQWEVNSYVWVRWHRTAGNIQYVKIELSKDGGISYPVTVVASVTASLNQYNWQVTNDITNQAKIRVSDTSNTAVLAESDLFKIKGKLTITRPNGDEKFVFNTSEAINWTVDGSISTVRLDFTTDGTNFTNIVPSVTASLGTKAWTIPDALSDTVRVKISDNSDPTNVLDLSDGTFRIVGTLTLLSPAGSEVWPVGSSQSVGWSRGGTINRVKIVYSINGGSSFDYTIADEVPGGQGSVNFNVPDTISPNVIVKVYDLDQAGVSAQNATPLKIRGDLVLTRPVGGESWLINSSEQIQWTRFGSITNAKLEYSLLAGQAGSWNNIATVPASDQSYNWPIPASTSLTVRIRVSDASDPTVYDDSPNFVIRGGFKITMPNGGEQWPVGSSQNIQWTTYGTYTNINLFYSKNSGTSWDLIQGGVSNIGTYPWASVADAISNTCLIKIADVSDTEAYDVSDAVFKIHGSINLTVPNGGEAWGVGTAQTITWTKAGSILGYWLEYSTNAFADETQTHTINNNVPGANTSFPWTIPDAIGANVKVRISDKNDPLVKDVSEASFRIRGSLTLSFPNGTESLLVGTNQTITWTSNGSIANVKLQLSTDGQVSWLSIVDSTPNDGSHPWQVPDEISSTCRVRVSDVDDPDAADISNQNFKIRGSVTLTYPVGGEKWTVGSSQNILWSRIGSIANVKLEFSNDGALFTEIVESTPNDGSYNWQVPDSITTKGLMRISDASDPTVTHTCAGFFKIQGSFDVTSPNGGEAWQAASQHDITWNKNGSVSFVNLYYSKDSGATWTAIPDGQNVPNNGVFTWYSIPVDAVSTKARIKVQDSSDSEAFDTSNSDYKVRCTLVLTYPNGSEHLRVGRSYNITWTQVGNPENIKLEYSRDNFLADYQTIEASLPTPPGRSYPWTVPNSIHETVKVRISDASDYGARDDSDAAFRITGDFAITAPNNGENWEVNSTQAITWNWAGTMSDVKLEYSINGGANYTTIGAYGNTGSRNWTVPDLVSESCRIRISDLSDSTANDVSDANFNIVPKFTVTSPNSGAEVWTVAESHPITWTTVGTITNVRIDLSTDGGSTYPIPVVASTPDDGSFDWTVTDHISDTVKIRVAHEAPFASDASDNSFKIKGDFDITSPDGGELWQINQAKTITWNTIGTIANVRIQYSINGGQDYTTIVNSKANTNSHSWTVPDTRTPSAKIKLINPADETVTDESAGTFRIQGFLTLNSPNGGETWMSEDSRQITWTWGGTLPTVKLSYSTDSGATFPYLINAAAQNGAGAGGTYSYAWTVPDTLTHKARVKVEDPDDDTVFDVSNADFTITGQITVTSPVGGERWVTNEVHAVTWTDKGKIDNVKIQYSKNGFGAAVTVVDSVPNVGSYNWTVPDDRSTTVKVRVLNADDETIYGTSPANFKIDYYTISWDIRDLLTNERLTNLSVSEKVTGGTTVGWQAVGLTAPLTHETPYGFWTTVWSATGYGDKGQNFTADRDQSFTVYLETSAVHIWRSSAEFTYDAAGDKLKVVAFLERDGSVVQGASKIGLYIYDDDGNHIPYNTVCDPDFYNVDNNADGEKDACDPRPTLYSNTIDASGYFYLTLPKPTGLEAGKVYAALVDIMNLSGAHFRTPTSFSITESKLLESTEAAVKNMELVTLPAFQQSISNTITKGIADQKQTITDIMVGTGGDPAAVMAQGGMVGMIQQSLTTFETSSSEAIKRLQSGADTAVQAGEELEATAKQFSWGATIAPDPALAGDTITLQVQGQPSKMPLVSIYTWDNKTIYSGQIMSETRPGFYVFSFLADTRFDVGKAYTYLVTESTTGGLVSGSGMVESMGITTVAGLAAAAPEAERAAKKALDAIKAVEAVLVSKDNVNIALTLQNLKSSVDSLPEVLNKEGPNTQLFNAVNDISEKLKGLMGEEGIDLGDLLDEKLGGSSTIKDMRKKTESINSIVDLLLQIMEAKLGGVDTPIVSTSLTSGSVKFRIMVVNPSKTRVQKVNVKKYLPEEVKLKDIMDAGGLDLEYDSEKGIYYAYKNDLELQTGESRVFDVEVEDIWLIPDATFVDLRKQVESAATRLKNTDFASRAEEIARTLPALIDEMQKGQVDEGISREQHIGLYRQNLQTIKKIQEEIAQMERVIRQSVGPQTPDILESKKLKVNLPGKTTTWLIIIVIIVFLGLLAGIFFFGWMAQMKSSQGSMDAQRKEAFPSGGDKKPEVKK